MDRTIVLIAGTAIGALLLGTWWVTRTPEGDMFADCRTSRIAGGAATIGGPFTLVDETGRTVTDKDVITKPTLVYFGYSFCPDVCPLDGARNAEAVALMAERGLDVGNVFVTVDPERDTSEVMAEFTDYFAPDMLGLTGTVEQVSEAARAYRVLFQKQDGDPDYYLVSHSTFTYLMFPDTGFAEFFNRDTTAEEMADRVGCFVNAV